MNPRIQDSGDPGMRLRDALGDMSPDRMSSVSSSSRIQRNHQDAQIQRQVQVRAVAFWPDKS